MRLPVRKPQNHTLPGCNSLAMGTEVCKKYRSRLSPGGLTHSLTFVKTVSFLLLIVLLTLSQGGCVIARYTRSPACTCATNSAIASARVTFSCYALFANEKIAKLAIDKSTKVTSAGVTIGAVETSIDDQAVQAVVSGVVEGVTKAVLK